VTGVASLSGFGGRVACGTQLCFPGSGGWNAASTISGVAEGAPGLLKRRSSQVGRRSVTVPGADLEDSTAATAWSDGFQFDLTRMRKGASDVDDPTDPGTAPGIRASV
jgi:hypothetical protein